MVLKNTGSTTVTYEWKKIERGDYIPSKNSDGIQRFYCHYPRDTLKPNESKTFIYSFRSEKPGMFNEEWELLTEPSLLEQAPLLNLSGMATKVDEYVEKVETFEKEFEMDLGKLHDNDVPNQDTTPHETTMQNTTDPLLMQKEFEAINEHTGLYFT